MVGIWFAVMGGEYSALDYRRLGVSHRSETEAIDRLTVEVDSLAEYLDGLLNDPATQERVARERFGMIRDGEILYRILPAN